MPDTLTQAQPALEFLPPALDPLVVRMAQFILPTWVRSRTSIADIQAENVETLVELYHQFQTGDIRFLMAFRHPSANDPYSLLYLLSRLVPQCAKQQGISLKSLVHAHFIYDRGIPLWAGSFISWLYPRLGGTPIHRGKLDRMGLRSARDLFINGLFPMAASPEGATNGHNEIISPLEPGIAQMGFWCIEDLLKAGRSEKVFIVPIGIQYYYLTPPWKALEKLLSELEVDSGLTPNNHNLDQTSLYQRLLRLGEHLLSLMEDFYIKFYHQHLPTASKKNAATEERSLNCNTQMAVRLEALLDVALKVAEEYFNIQPKGTVIDRCRRLEQAGWDYIYREDIKNPETLSPLERGLADRIAAEANLRMWHMRLVESFVAVTGAYVLEKPTAERFADTTLLMWDILTRIKGSNPFNRPSLGKQRVQMTVGEPISVSDRWHTYQTSRRAAKQAVTELTQDLQTALGKMIQ